MAKLSCTSSTFESSPRIFLSSASNYFASFNFPYFFSSAIFSYSWKWSHIRILIRVTCCVYLSRCTWGHITAKSLIVISWPSTVLQYSFEITCNRRKMWIMNSVLTMSNIMTKKPIACLWCWLPKKSRVSVAQPATNSNSLPVTFLFSNLSRHDSERSSVKIFVSILHSFFPLQFSLKNFWIFSYILSSLKNDEDSWRHSESRLYLVTLRCECLGSSLRFRRGFTKSLKNSGSNFSD